MSRNPGVLATIAVVAAAAAASGQDPTPVPFGPRRGPTPAPVTSSFRIARISTSCWAAVSTNGGSNAGFVVGRDGVLVIDALGSPARAERFMREIAAVTSAKILAFALTHWHYDHTVGNQKLPPGVPIYADARTREMLRERLAADKLLLGPMSGAHGTVEIADVRVPTHDVRGQTEIDLGGGTRVTLVSFKAGGHSTGDIVAWVASEKVLYIGDLVTNGYVPNLGDAETFSWVGLLATLPRLKPEKVVPGHGEPGGPEIIDAQRDYLMTLRSLVRHLARMKVAENDIVKSLSIPREFETLGFREWWPQNVRYVYREIVAGN